MAARKTKLTKLPGAGTVHLDMSTVVCVRTETGDHGASVVVHTDQGFAVAVPPTEDQTVSQLADEILRLVP